MLNRNHPDDERLSALASQEADAMADAALTAHVASCPQCTTMVDELTVLTANLAALPDVAPNRPLRLVPEVTHGADRLGTWVRKVFAPVMAAGTALALVGMVGTVAPSLSSQAASGAGHELASSPDAFERWSLEPAAGGPNSLRSAGTPDDPSTTGEDSSDGGAEVAPRATTDDDSTAFIAPDTEATRSVWPMVLFAGVAVLIAGALLRWIVVPRAG
jgi:hypothetical protein